MSSDSEDDCYGNVAKKLQNMKDKYEKDLVKNMDLLDDSLEMNENVKKDDFAAFEPKPPSVDDDDSPGQVLPDVPQEIVVPKTSKRVTRSSARKNSADAPSANVVPPKRSRKQKNAPATTLSVTSAAPSSAPAEPSAPRGRNSRGRGRQMQNTESPVTPPVRGRRSNRSRGRGQRNRQSVLDYFANIFNSYPTYSVGNTDEYTDQSNNQPLFSKPNVNTNATNDEVIVVEEDNLLTDNEELSVKVYWQSTEFFKFTIRKYQKLTQIFEYFAQKENVGMDNLLLTYNEKVLKSDDTPDSIDYSIVKFIEGGITNDSVSKFMSGDSKKDGIKLKFQCQNVKKPLEVTMQLDNKMLVAMMKCAEHLEKPLEKLKFEFDGDCISGKSTARELELEGGECIDVRIIS